MTNNSDRDEQQRATKLTIGLTALALVMFLILVWVAASIGPSMLASMNDTFSAGVGLKGAAIAAAVVSFVVLITFAVFAGDGLLGELQFMIPGFFLFYMFFWLMLAWVF